MAYIGRPQATGPYIKNYQFSTKEVRTQEDFIKSMKMIISSIIDTYSFEGDSIGLGYTPLKFLVQSDTDSSKTHTVEYKAGLWICSCSWLFSILCCICVICCIC